MKWFQHSIISHFLVSGLFIIIKKDTKIQKSNYVETICVFFVAGEWFRYVSKLRVPIQNPLITEVCVV